MKKLTKNLGFAILTLELLSIGEDYSLFLYGGEVPHIGCTVLTSPRPSLEGDGTISCTSSVLNLAGHKDEFICRPLAEAFCKETGRTVVCTGGVHMDHATQEQIYAIRDAVADLTDELLFP